ncbi:MAG: hypothetical protein PWQ82_1139 [Thermosediminibacterales bacterium]|nr:hypothetical protein [Thermosediminibacterales bacterium]MDK2835667.1 hypothetical protein [Thermosediminibacterales bacterium]
MIIIFLNKLKEKYQQAIRKINPEIDLVVAEKIKDVPEEKYKNAEIIVGWGFSDEWTPEILEKAENLKWLHMLSAGVDKVPLEPLEKKGVIVTNSKGIHGIPIAEHVLGMMLAFARGLNIMRDQQMRKEWKRVRTDELWNKTLGIIGLGSIGAEIAKRAKAFGMKVIGLKRNVVKIEGVDEVWPNDRLIDLLKNSDYVVIAVPLNKETYHLIGEKELNVMKKEAYLINIGRGDLVDEHALIKALRSGRIKGFGSDVFSQEPLPADSPLYEMENVIITPHQSGLSPMYMKRAMDIFTQNLQAYLSSSPMKNVVDFKLGY